MSDQIIFMEGTIISIRKLVALDIALHGWGIITAEFLFGVFGIAAISLLLPGNMILSVYMMLIALNYVPVLIYALAIKNRKNAKKEVWIEMSHMERYGLKYSLQQFLIFIPFSIIVVSIAQEIINR
jgi:hypothetical protein